MKALQQWLTLQRQLKSLSQLELAQRLNKSVHYIQQIEQGLCFLEIIEYLHYCRTLGIDPNIGIALLEKEIKAQTD